VSSAQTGCVRKVQDRGTESRIDESLLLIPICNSTPDDLERFNACMTTIVDLHENSHFK
jgi:hypothetical protein